MNELEKFLHSYFHQDWKEEFSSYGGVVGAAAMGYGKAEVSALADEIDELLARKTTDEELKVALIKLSVDYLPDDAREWLRAIVTALKREI